MRKFKDLTGLEQGRLKVLKILEEKKGNDYQYECQCSCGNVVIKSANTLRAGTKSCGCLRTENARKALESTRDIHKTHGMSKTTTYICWRNMKARCDDPNHQAAINYGERGISYPEHWKSFEGFYDDMGDCPEGYSLNRIDVNLNYSKENCEWADAWKQGRDRRKPKVGSSLYKGVVFNKREGKYKATLIYKGINYHLGYSDDPLELAVRYDNKVLELTGEDCGTNRQLGLLPC